MDAPLDLQGQTVAVTGHRPPKLGGYGPYARKVLHAFARQALSNSRPDRVITGMALGWDTAIALACLDLSIPFVAAIPSHKQEERWFPEDQAIYNRILTHPLCNAHLVSEDLNPTNAAFQRRNKWMIDHGDVIVALWNRHLKGGTYNAVRYAQLQHEKKPLINLWDEYCIFKDQAQ